ncbi:hypothetical protein [uncultured Roseibium sp.]|uniref:hypothetical protein n=1 Tax=uncultured Roseibium sp. TaxID=1936171 RepID=UPI0025984025|nr:hypothetical protein [uncultured Roseibium sp.]
MRFTCVLPHPLKKRAFDQTSYEGRYDPLVFFVKTGAVVRNEMKIRLGRKESIALLLLLLSIVTIEIGLLGFPLRVDLAVLGVSLILNFVSTFLGLMLIMIFGISLGKSGLVSGILVLSPFFARPLGEMCGFLKEGILQKLLYTLLGMVVIQFLSGQQLVGFFYNSNTITNVLPHAGFATEPSFFFEILSFLIFFILAMGGDWRRFFYNFLLFFLVCLMTNTLTGIQNFIVFFLVAGFCLLPISRSVFAPLILLAPTFFVYVFPVFSEWGGDIFLKEFKSWRQLGNIVGISASNFFDFRVYDYRELVSEHLLAQGRYNLFYWIESAFSWLPFLHTIFGMVPSLIIALAFIFYNKQAFFKSFTIRVCAYTSCFLFLYTAPKWQMYYPILLSFCAVRANGFERKQKVSKIEALAH